MSYKLSWLRSSGRHISFAALKKSNYKYTAVHEVCQAGFLKKSRKSEKNEEDDIKKDVLKGVLLRQRALFDSGFTENQKVIFCCRS